MSGTVAPNQAETKVKVTLYRKQGGGFEKIKQQRPTLNSASKYKTKSKVARTQVAARSS